MIIDCSKNKIGFNFAKSFELRLLALQEQRHVFTISVFLSMANLQLFNTGMSVDDKLELLFIKG